MNINTTVVREVAPIKSIKLTLDLTVAEAMVLRVLTNRIDGEPTGPRGMFDDIRCELDNNNIRLDESLIPNIRDSINFCSTYPRV